MQMFYVPAPAGKSKKLARILIEKEAAACVNIVHGTSIYRWKGRIEDNPESYLIIKTSSPDRLREILGRFHPYDTPAIIQLQASANQAYEAFVSDAAPTAAGSSGFTLETQKRKIYDLTSQINQVLESQKAGHGVAHVFAPHATGVLFVGENEPNINADYLNLFEKLAPEGPKAGWAHDQIDNNAHAHLRSVLVGASLTLPVREGKLALGTWQKVMFAEVDGSRHRRFMLTVVPA